MKLFNVLVILLFIPAIGTGQSNDINKFEQMTNALIMGLEEDDYHLLRYNEVSDSTIDKITGNGIVVDVFEHLMKSVTNIYL